MTAEETSQGITELPDSDWQDILLGFRGLTLSGISLKREVTGQKGPHRNLRDIADLTITSHIHLL